jgi:hypothetical protein
MDIKRRVQEWFGLDAIALCCRSTDLELRSILSEQQQIAAHLAELLAQCQRIEQKLSINHLDKPVDRVSSTSYDWDTVQLMQLQEMQKNPPKEN